VYTPPRQENTQFFVYLISELFVFNTQKQLEKKMASIHSGQFDSQENEVKLVPPDDRF